MLAAAGEGMLGKRASEARRPPPEAFAEAQHKNLAIARRRTELQGKLTAEISTSEALGDLHWYVLTVTPGRERTAFAHLAGRRFGAYLPMIDEMVRDRGDWRLQHRPILPGYVFVCSIGLVGRWRRARACPGVVEFLNRAGTDQPAAIPHRFVEELRAYEAAENAHHDRIHGRAYDRPRKKAKSRAASRKAKERIKRRAKELRRRQRQATARLP